MPASQEHNIDGRVSVLETSVEQLHGQVAAMSRQMNEGFDKLYSSISAAGRTNWGLILSAAALLFTLGGVMYSGAIRPLEKDIERQTRVAETLASAVLVKEEKIGTMRERLGELAKDTQNQLDGLRERQAELRTNGSPVLERRISLLESDLKALNHSFSVVRDNGTPEAIKRLALLEFQMGELRGKLVKP